MDALHALRSNVTYQDAQRMLSGRELRRYNEAWTWSAHRFGGDAGRRQDRFFNREDGPEILIGRINRMRRFLGFPEYD